MLEIAIFSYQDFERSKCYLKAILKELTLAICHLSTGRAFHCLAPSTEKNFAK